jgi:hypothetical protein
MARRSFCRHLGALLIKNAKIKARLSPSLCRRLCRHTAQHAIAHTRSHAHTLTNLISHAGSHAMDHCPRDRPAGPHHAGHGGPARSVLEQVVRRRFAHRGHVLSERNNERRLVGHVSQSQGCGWPRWRKDCLPARDVRRANRQRVRRSLSAACSECVALEFHRRRSVDVHAEQGVRYQHHC